MKLKIILPAYNEAANLTGLLSSLASTLRHIQADFELLVIDDGSSDETIIVAEQASHTLPVRVLRHGNNRGLGAAIKTGLCQLDADDDVVITMDSDNSHLPAHIPEMLAKLSQGYDVVIASRYARGARIVGVPRYRLLLSGGASVLFRIFFPIPGIRDYTCGYRAIRASTMRALVGALGENVVTENGFASSVELLLNLRRVDARIAEIPITLRYDCKLGASKMRVFQTIQKTLRLIARYLQIEPIEVTSALDHQFESQMLEKTTTMHSV